MLQKNLLTKGILKRMMLIVIFSAALDSWAQSNKIVTSLFHETNRVMSTAKRENADILAPVTYSNATELVKKAEKDHLSGRKDEIIIKQLNAAIVEFKKSVRSARIAAVAFGFELQVRTDAMLAEASNFAPDLWNRAERKLKEAAQSLERGTVREAREKVGEAERIYREAELRAVKNHYMGEAYRWIQEAEKIKASLYVPKTLAKAKDLVKQAEQELDKNRGDTDIARVSARLAMKEARHAVYLANVIKNIKESNTGMEEVLLASETPLKRIAGSLNIAIAYEEGFSRSTDEILKNIETLKNDNQRYTNGLFESGQLVDLLRARIEELEMKLGDIEAEKSTLAGRIDTYEKVQEKYLSIENMFTPEEAVILREGNDLRIRLTGLMFNIGKTVIEPRYYSFLARVVKTIALFTDAAITVEGHTDSFGDDRSNLNLSRERAENVRLYLLNNTAFSTGSIEAIGYGESRPIASNESEDGRAKNRRIAIVIHPNLTTGF